MTVGRICFAVGVLVAISYSMGELVTEADAREPSTCYTTFWPRGDDRVELVACEYKSGTSGYTILRNKTNRVLEVCWTAHYADGSTNRGCNSGLTPGETSSSCYRCNRGNKHGGMVDVTWRKVEAGN